MITSKKSNKLPYKTIFIDWNGTLSSSKFWGHLEDKEHPKHEMFEKIESTLFGELRPLIKPWMRGELTSEKVIKQIADKANIPYEEALSEFIVSCEEMNFVAEDLLKDIKDIRGKGVSVVIATDNMDSFPRYTIPALSLNEHFDAILDSHTLKAMKGDVDENGKSKFFDKYFSENGIEAIESMLIDDSEDKDGKVSEFGIEYRKIDPVVGLPLELKKIIALFD